MSSRNRAIADLFVMDCEDVPRTCGIGFECLLVIYQVFNMDYKCEVYKSFAQSPRGPSSNQQKAR